MEWKKGLVPNGIYWVFGKGDAVPFVSEVWNRKRYCKLFFLGCEESEERNPEECWFWGPLESPPLPKKS
jgi:hypothetical protein